jgi:hypothetical protein
LAGERDRQHPDPGRPGDDAAHEHDGVQPDDRRRGGEAHHDVAKAAQAAVEILLVAKLAQARRVGVDSGCGGILGHTG